MRSRKGRDTFKGATISRAGVREVIEDALQGKLSKKLCLHMADYRYYLPKYSEAKKIIDNSKMEPLAAPSDGKVRGERFDCDDFALLLKARFAFAAYRDRSQYQNHPHCFGIVWGLLPFPFPHSMNWMITANKKFYFVEPQRQKILKSNQCRGFRHINFLLV